MQQQLQEQGPQEGLIGVYVHPRNIREWVLLLRGPANTPYANELYRLIVRIPKGYPMKPPICFFSTPGQLGGKQRAVLFLTSPHPDIPTKFLRCGSCSQVLCKASLFFVAAPKHPHIYSNGDICLNLLQSDWHPSLSIEKIARAILSMMASAKHKQTPLDDALRKLLAACLHSAHTNQQALVSRMVCDSYPVIWHWALCSWLRTAQCVRKTTTHVYQI